MGVSEHLQSFEFCSEIKFIDSYTGQTMAKKNQLPSQSLCIFAKKRKASLHVLPASFETKNSQFRHNA